MENSRKNNKKTKKKTNKIIYNLGSLVLAAGAAIVFPKIIDKASSYIYDYQHRFNQNNADDIDDDWGPKIVKKQK